MDRQLVFPGQIPLETDLLKTNRSVMIALGKLAGAVFGTATVVNGLACTATSPASMSVQVGPGEIYSLANVDGTAYSSLAADTTHSVVKQGILMDAITLSCPAPSTSGYSVNYLIQAAFQEVDTNSVTLPYYNSSNPTQAYAGPNNSGASQATTRQGALVVQAKAGIAAATGSQTTPAADAGYVGLWVVTVANGASSITSSNISKAPGAPFLSPMDSALRSDLASFASAIKGPGQIGFSASLAYASTSVGGRLRDRWVSVKDYPFSAVGDGVADDTAAIVAALNSGASVVFMPPGVYKFTAQLSTPAYVTLCGAGYGLTTGTGASRLLKSGNFTGVVVNGASQLLDVTVDGAPGNGGDGVQVLGGRSLVRGVAAINQGQDGIKVGGYSGQTTANTNMWRLENVIARGNGRHGVFIAHEGMAAAPNNNAGTALGIEASANAQHGLAMSETFDNQIFGLCSQTNGGQGLYLGNYAKGNFIAQPYTEANTAGDGLLDTGSGRNFLLGYRGGQINDGWVNLGTGNTVWGRQGSIQDVPLHKSPEAFHDLRILEDTTSGVWSLKKEATTRNLLIDLLSTATADITIQSSGGGTAGLRFGTNTNQVAIRDIISGTGSVNWGNVPANSTVDQTLTPVGSSTSHAFTATPLFSVPSGITISCFFNGTSVVVRATNNTAAAIAVTGNVKVLGFKIA